MTRTRSGLQIGDDKDDKSAYPKDEKLSQRREGMNKGSVHESVLVQELLSSLVGVESRLNRKYVIVC